VRANRSTAALINAWVIQGMSAPKAGLRWILAEILSANHTDGLEVYLMKC